VDFRTADKVVPASCAPPARLPPVEISNFSFSERDLTGRDGALRNFKR